MTVLLASFRALLVLLRELLFGPRLLPSRRLQIRGVDRAHAASSKGRELKAFIDGSVQLKGTCGFSVFYHAGHPLNAHGRFEPAPSSPDANLAELVALFWAVANHPREQHLTIFSDSAHALRCVQALAENGAEGGVGGGGGGGGGRGSGGRKRGRRQAPPPRPAQVNDVRWAPIIRLIWWLLRLRTAQTCFFKVPAHRGVRQNETADALAKTGADSEHVCDVPHRASLAHTCRLLLRFLTQESLCLGSGARGGARQPPPARRPEPTGSSLEVSSVLALDCEMVGTGPSTLDSKLASVCVVNAAGNQVFFSYAAPSRKVTDYRTQYSGIRPYMLEGAPRVEEVQRRVRELVAGRVVVGHGLENDFKVLGLHHPRHLVRDTAHDFRRYLSPRGRPRKLRHITNEFLGLKIQDGEHDPCEDARAALLLYQRYQKQFDEAVAKRELARAKAVAAAAVAGSSAGEGSSTPLMTQEDADEQSPENDDGEDLDETG